MKNLISKISLVAILFGATLFLSSCEDDKDDIIIDIPHTEKSVVQIASDDENFSLLVEALTKADLVSALEGDGPFTVFAPTNTAFENLFTQLGVNGIDDLSAEALTPILLYHVVNAKAISTDLSTGYITTMNTTTPDNMGSSLLVSVDMGVMLNGTSTVTTADLLGKNGVIHVIDQVLVQPSIVDIALSNPNFSILVEALVKADLVTALSATGPFTVFAPTNAAFEALFIDLNVSGIADLTAEALTPILLYHVVGDNVNASEVMTGMVPTLNTSAQLNIKVSDMGVMLNDNANVVVVDVQGSNGVIHAIDQVLLPSVTSNGSGKEISEGTEIDIQVNR
jgi:transforming growth factor-beta-induced protein